MSDNRRGDTRTDISIPTRITYETPSSSNLNDQMAKTKNISLGGAQLELSRVREIEDLQKLEFRLPDLPVRIIARGEMKWNSKTNGKYLIGVEFTTFPNTDRKQLEEYLKRIVTTSLSKKASLTQFEQFKEYLIRKKELANEVQQKINNMAPDDLYSRTKNFGLESGEISKLVADFLDVTYFPSLDHEIANIQNLSNQFCRANRIAPVWGDHGERLIVLSNPYRHVCHSVFQKLYDGEHGEFAITEPENIEALFSDNGLDHTDTERGKASETSMASHYQTSDGVFLLEPEEAREEDDSPSIEAAAREKFEHLKKQKEEARKDRVINLVNKLLKTAVEEEVSDIHLEPREQKLNVRYRDDGILKHKWELPKEMAQAIVSRIKIMADMDIAERRKPLDGGFKMKYEDRCIDVRVSTIPLNTGEKTVMRILDKKQVPTSLSDLGFKEKTTNLLEEKLETNKGILFFTGPTGSGKTTSMYSCLKKLYAPEVNIQTIENPIEYNISGINQMQLNEKAGLTYPRALKGILRQDPDILMVGEIRNHETLDIAAKAAMSGHLVLSTLHTNDAPSTVNRLLNIGLDPYIVASTIQIVIAQRLIRRLCPECKTPVDNPSYYIEKYEIPIDRYENSKIYEANGCDECDGLGLSGQMGVMECLPTTETMRQAIRQKKGTDYIRSMMNEELGLNTLRQNAFHKVALGETSVKEALRITMK